jgi:hypothetical protein
MSFTVLSKGVLCEANFIFEKVLRHDADDSFIFILGYRQLKYRVYVYGDYSYLIILPAEVTEASIFIYETLSNTIETLMSNFLSFCQTVNKNCIYNCEQEIGYFLLITLGIYVSDWNIWYACFSSPYQRLVYRTENDCALFSQLKLVNTT